MATVTTGIATEAASLGASLGLNDAELDLLGMLFGEFASASGLNGTAIFTRMRQGKSIGEALDLPKGSNELLYDRAHKWFSAGRIDKAQPLFRALCILDGRDANYQIGYSVCLRQSGDLDQAKLAMERALLLRPDWAVARYHAIELFARTGDWARVTAELAVFDRLPTADLPRQMLQEIDRYRLALDMRRQHAPGGNA